MADDPLMLSAMILIGRRGGWIRVGMVCVSLTISVVAYGMVRYWLNEEQRILRARIAALEQQQRWLVLDLQKQRQIQLANHQYQTAAFNERWFVTFEPTTLVRHFYRIASQTGIQLTQFHWQSPIEHETYTQYPFSLMLSGETPLLFVFLEQVATVRPEVTFYRVRWFRHAQSHGSIQINLEGAIHRRH